MAKKKVYASMAGVKSDPFALCPEVKDSDTVTDDDCLEFFEAAGGETSEDSSSDSLVGMLPQQCPPTEKAGSNHSGEKEPSLKEMAPMVEAMSTRLQKAIDAEHEGELRELLDRLSAESRETMLKGLKIEPAGDKQDNCYRVTRPDNLKFPKNCFEVKSHISVLCDIKPKSDPQEEGATVEEDLVEDLGATGDNLFRAHGSDGESDAVNPSRVMLGSHLQRLGVRKCFEGVVREVKPSYMIIFSNDEDAWEQVEEAKDTAHWALLESMNDVTYRRMRSAALSLGVIIRYEKKEGEVEKPDTDELRVRRILLGTTRDNKPPSRLAAECPSFMTDGAREQLRSALEKYHLNERQNTFLNTAFVRSFNLLQGPPGTGKSRTLATAVKALCRVFHDSGCADVAAVRGFSLPTLDKLGDWNDEHVTAWVQSLVTAEHAKKSEMSGHRVRAADGVTDEIKSLLLVGLKGTTGHELNMKFGNLGILENNLKEANLEADTQDAEDVGSKATDAAKRCLSVLLGLRQQLKQCLDNSTSATAWKAVSHREMRILVSAETNVAVDKIMESVVEDKEFMARKYNILRMGGEMASPHLKEYSLEYQRAESPLMKAYMQLKKAIDEDKVTIKLGDQLESDLDKFCEARLEYIKKGQMTPKTQEQLQEMIQMLKTDILFNIRDKIRRLENKEARLSDVRKLNKLLKQMATFDIVVRAQVVFGTNSGMGELRSGCQTLKLSNPIVLMDESGQSMEPSSLIPLTLGASWVLMAADLKQLRPIFKTKAAATELGYFWAGGGSLYGRLRCRSELPEEMLTFQYRMHPSIREFPSDRFYNGQLSEDPHATLDTRIPVPRDRDGRPYLWWPFQRAAARAGSSSAAGRPKGGKEFPVVFFHAEGDQKQGLDNFRGLDRSFCNHEEAHLAIELMLLFGTDRTVKSIVIITPYKAQCVLLNRILERCQEELHRRQAKGFFHPDIATAKAYTIDGYQGQEADVVIITTVRSKLAGRPIGHLADARRMNVAITRAKRALLVVGDADSLCSVPTATIDKGVGDVVNYWPEWIDWVRNKGSFVHRADVKHYFDGYVHRP